MLDSVPGMPFVNENGETDIAFVMGEEVVLLSEMYVNPLFENCGWFSSAWKKFANVATVIFAVAVVFAAPEVVAAIPTVSTVALASGGTADVLTGGGAAAAMTAGSAAAAATLPTIAAATATSLAIAAVDAGIDAAKEENSNQANTKESYDTWVNKDTLADHYDRHGDDFDSENEEDYAKKANDFYKDRANHQIKTDESGTVRVYDLKTNTFGSYTADGKIETFFKLIDVQAYFDRQPGK